MRVALLLYADVAAAAQATMQEAEAELQRLPVAHHGRVEIRPLMDMPDPGSSPI